MIDKILLCLAAGALVYGGMEVYDACLSIASDYQEQAWDRNDQYQKFMREELPSDWNLPTETRPPKLNLPKPE